jgi:phage shock protein A
VKQSIEWHEKCLINAKATAERLYAEARRAKDMADNANADAEFLEHQILMAKHKGKDGFDPDRFCRKVPANV